MPAVDRETTPSGDYLAARLQQRARELGIDLSAQVHRYHHRSSYGVQVDWPRDPSGAGIHCEVAERGDSVILPEPRPTQLRIEQAVTYVVARVQGSSHGDALASAKPRGRWGRPGR